MRIGLAFTACVLIWGTTWYAIEWQLGYVAKGWSLVYRYGIATAILFAWCSYKRMPLTFGREAHLYMMGTGLFLFSGNYALVYWGTEYLTSGLVAVTFSLLTFMNVLNARFFLGVRIEATTALAALMGVSGLVLIFKPEIDTLSFTDNTTIGLTLCIVSTLIASLGNTVAGAKTAKSLPIMPFNAWAMGYGTLFNLLFAMIEGKAPNLDPRPEYYIALLYLSVLGTVVAFSIFLWLLGEIGVARGGYMAAMTPLVALLVSTLFEAYQWTAFAASGVALILGGNILIIKSKGKSAPPTKASSS